MSGFFTVEKIH